MIIIWDQRMCGKVDHVANLFYVHTQFFHLYYVPLFPLKTFLVIAGTEGDDGFQGKQISLSLKSVLIGWLRTVLILAMVVSVISGIINGISYLDHQQPHNMNLTLFMMGVLLAAILIYWLTLRMNRASYWRALELGEELGVPKHAIAQLYVAEAGAEVDTQGPGHDAPNLPDDAFKRWNQ
jgi:hypothetical protein